MKNIQLLIVAAVLTLVGSARAQGTFGAQRLRADGAPYTYPTVVYSQSVVSNPSAAYNNVVNLHWRRGAGTNYVVLAGRYLQRSPYDGTFPTPSPPFFPAPAGPGNGLMDTNSRLPAYSPNYEIAPHLIKTGRYQGNAADTTAQLLNARPGETYYAFIWEYNLVSGVAEPLSAPPTSNLSWQALFTQFHAAPRITSVTLDAQRRPVVTWTTATEDTVKGFRILQSGSPATTNGLLSGTGRITRLSSVRPTGYSQTISTYSQTLPDPVNALTYFQVTQFLTDNSTFVADAPFWSNVVSTPVPLPVTLVSFTAQRRHSGAMGVQLNWVTATELNNRGFQLERSPDGTRWGRVAFVAGSGTRTGLTSYGHVDSCRTAAYYRLGQVDFSGPVSYGPVRYVKASGGASPNARLVLVPTPATDAVSLLNVDPDQPVQVLNVLGRQEHLLPAGTVRFGVGSWRRGMYFVRQGQQVAKLLLE